MSEETYPTARLTEIVEQISDHMSRAVAVVLHVGHATPLETLAADQVPSWAVELDVGLDCLLVTLVVCGRCEIGGWLLFGLREGQVCARDRSFQVVGVGFVEDVGDVDTSQAPVDLGILG